MRSAKRVRHDERIERCPAFLTSIVVTVRRWTFRVDDLMSYTQAALAMQVIFTMLSSKT